MVRARPSAAGSDDHATLFTPAFLALSLSELAYFTAFGLMIPVVPLFATGPLHAGPAGVGLAVGAFSVMALVLRPFAGRLSDRRGRRPLLLTGGLLFAMVTAGHPGPAGSAWQSLRRCSPRAFPKPRSPNGTPPISRSSTVPCWHPAWRSSPVWRDRAAPSTGGGLASGTQMPSAAGRAVSGRHLALH
jgi:MFS family permease